MAKAKTLKTDEELLKHLDEDHLNQPGPIRRGGKGMQGGERLVLMENGSKAVAAAPISRPSCVADEFYSACSMRSAGLDFDRFFLLNPTKFVFATTTVVKRCPAMRPSRAEMIGRVLTRFTRAVAVLAAAVCALDDEPMSLLANAVGWNQDHVDDWNFGLHRSLLADRPRQMRTVDRRRLNFAFAID